MSKTQESFIFAVNELERYKTMTILKYCSAKDIDLAIECLKIAINNTETMHSGQVIKAPLNRVIFQLEELKKLDMKDLLE